MRHIRGVVLTIFSFALVIAGFQNCSQSLPADNMGADTSSSLSIATPTPAPLSGSYLPNPAAVGATITISGIGGVAPYTYIKTSGNGSLSGQTYTAPVTAETATITVIDSAGQSFPVTITVYAATPAPTSTPASTPTPVPTVPVYRFYNPRAVEHFFTLNQNDPSSTGFNVEGIGFYVYAQADGQQTTLLYRCLIAGNYGSGFSDHLVSNQQGCEGYTNEGPYGYVYTSQVSGTVPLYRMHGNYDYIATKDPNEGAAQGYTLEGILGYVPQ